MPCERMHSMGAPSGSSASGVVKKCGMEPYQCRTGNRYGDESQNESFVINCM